MGLPQPLPDDPKKWEGWRQYNSENPYERLCLNFEENPTHEMIEENCRQLLIWWQKKLPLKNQPSNPVAAMLRSGLDEAPRYLSQARAELLNEELRKEVDARILEERMLKAWEEFHKFLTFSLSGRVLSSEDEQRLQEFGERKQLDREEVYQRIEEELEKAGAKRVGPVEAVSPTVSTLEQSPVQKSPSPNNPEEEFWRLLNLSGLTGDEMTDDQRDALINMAENLGIAGGRAEDIVDEWIEASEELEMGGGAIPAELPSVKPVEAPVVKTVTPAVKTSAIFSTPFPDLSPEEERHKFPSYKSPLYGTMLLIPSGEFEMGSNMGMAAPNERPAHRVRITRFYLAQVPVTNRLYEQFDSSHRVKRPGWAGDDHPVVYVSSLEAMEFCKWLSKREGKKFRLPTEAEWEYAARGKEGLLYPWGNHFPVEALANFADKNTRFAWSDPRVDDGFAEGAPVGSYPRGVSPFGVLDMAGNVWEWCSDYYESYRSSEQTNPKGPARGSQRIYRGGSWRSKSSSLRSVSRGMNIPTYSYQDVGFRIAQECE